jgi:hypothetical protein
MPKLWLLTEQVDGIELHQCIDALPSIGREVQKPGFGKFKPAAKPKEEKNMEGTVTCILLDERNTDPQLLVGFESGAIGMFKLILELIDGKKTIKITKLFSAQKLI